MRSKFFGLSILALSMFGIVVVFFSMFPCLVAVQAQATNEITLYGSAFQGWGFTEQTITSPGPQISFQEGELYSMTLISADGITHKFFVDYNGNGNPDSDEPVSPNFSSTVNYQFTPDRTGEFTYYCSFHPATMFGNASVVPEFGTLTLLVVIALTTITIIAYKKRINKRHD